jgi:hypothetical protein
MTKYVDSGIGSPRPHLAGLSATVPGLQSDNWAPVYADLKFGTAQNAGYRSYLFWFFGGVGGADAASSFKVFLATLRSRSAIGGGTH